jgi:predicted MPP superfamily phosphohydrolase
MPFDSVSTSRIHRIRILHISDLHERGRRESELWRRRRVLGKAWENNLQELLQEGPIDLVCFTGDVADWGLPEEYQAATDFFSALLKRLNLPAERLFVVPGNHDVYRNCQNRTWKSVRRAIANGVDPLALSRWMAGTSEPPRGFKDKWKEEILERGAAYVSWVRQWRKAKRVLSPLLLGYRETLKIRTLPFPLHIVGLNTAWLSGKDGETGELWLTEHQLMKHSTDENGEPLDGLRILLMHHPFSELADGSHCRRLLANHIDLVLRGHLHEPEVETWADPDRIVRQVAAGCLYEGHQADQFPNACQLIELGADHNGSLSQIELRFRSWSSRGGFWHDDTSLYKGAKHGRLSWTVERTRPLQSEYNPYSPWTPVTPPTFVGRTSLFQILENALQERRGVSLVGTWRSGKSSVLATWEQLAGTKGRIVKSASGEGPEGASHSTFVQHITGSEAPTDSDGAMNALSRWVDLVATSGLPPLLLFDEVDNLIAKFDERFWERLRGMLGRVAVVVASRQELDYLYSKVNRTSPFQNRLQLEWLSLLELDAAEQLIHFSDDLVSPTGQEAMREWAGCHPFYLQLIGYHLVFARIHGKSEAEALTRFRTESAARLRELWQVLDERDRENLKAVVEGRPITRSTLRNICLVGADGKPFGRVLSEWVKEET